MSDKKRLVYIAPGKSSFVMQDIHFLQKEFEVTSYFFDASKKWLVPFELIKQMLVLLFNRRAIFLVSFGGYHSLIATFIAKIRGFKCYIILNGTDCAAIPEFSYGHLRGGLISWACKQSYKLADGLFPVSESLIETENGYAFTPPKKLGLRSQGIEHKFVSVIPNGFETNFWKRVSDKIPNTFITVSGPKGFELKGLDLFIALAKSRPKDQFRIAGLSELHNCPPNVELLGYLSREELRQAFSESQYFVQLSIWEGFGCALCEAMLCECIPIVSDVNMLPEIVGEQGIVLKKRAFVKLHELIDATTMPNASVFRKLIVEQFPIHRRIELLSKYL